YPRTVAPFLMFASTPSTLNAFDLPGGSLAFVHPQEKGEGRKREPSSTFQHLPPPSRTFCTPSVHLPGDGRRKREKRWSEERGGVDQPSLYSPLLSGGCSSFENFC